MKKELAPQDEIAALRQIIKDAIRVLNYDGLRPLNRLMEARADMIASVQDIDRVKNESQN